ncbi:hypothetical protein [Azohydromonas caseinilytica]|uniref:Uncharacterized protein n=1 Tax=Azohydromonas caseinilytica TaxID=2728836 RepID=A0A848FD84_9BURK|nr:hypothetical protein [Azohydromonas caseinilytica]NML17424.1 hypothetical protein [Azohydromonas caseinilytica]
MDEPVFDIENRDGAGVMTYQYVDIDSSVTIELPRGRQVARINDASRGKLSERKRLDARVIH